MGGSHICADYSPSFTVVGADMFLRNNIHHSDWSFSYSVESRIFVPIVHRLSRWSVRVCFFSALFLIKIIRFHILLGSHICADYSPSFTVVGADMFLRNNIHNSEWSFSYSVESRIFVPIVHRLSRWSVR